MGLMSEDLSSRSGRRSGVSAAGAAIAFGVALAAAAWAVSGAWAETPVTPTPPADAAPPNFETAETDPNAPTAAREYLSAEEFRAAFEGRTAHLHDNSGLHYGSEYYIPGDRTVWVPGDGPCMPGRWVTDGPHICFYYDQAGGPHCWTIFRENGAFFAQSAETALLLEVYAVEEIPLSCDPELLS